VLSRRLIQIAVFYFAIGVLMGIYMGITQNFSLVHVHVHVNLLGWVALGLIGAIYAAYPMSQRGVLPKLHFWLHNLGLPVFMGGYAYGVIAQHKVIAPLAVGSSMIAIGVLLLAVHLIRRLAYESTTGVAA
jgi:cbb3-type cytochrome oxidase subunit 1